MSATVEKQEESVKWSANLDNYVIQYMIIMSKHRSVFQGMYGEEKVVIKVVRLTKRELDKIFLQRELGFLRSADHRNIRDFCQIKEPSLAGTHLFYASTHCYELPVLLDLRRKEISNSRSDEDSDSDKVELPLSEKCVQQMTKQVISGLSYLHQQGFLHTRLRKEYITLNQEGVVKLIGFARMVMIEEDEEEVDIRNGFTAEPYEIKDETFFLGLLCVELLLDESPFDPDVLFGRPGRRVRQYQQAYKTMKKRRVFSLSAIYPDGDPDKIEKLERNLSYDGRSFLEQTIFSTKDSRSTCEDLQEHSWIKGKEDLDVIVKELANADATEKADCILRRENAVMWFETMTLGTGRILISILASTKGGCHLYLPFTAPMPREDNIPEIRQIIEYNVLQMVGVAVTNVQYFQLIEKMMEKMGIVYRVPHVVLREVLGFQTGPDMDVYNGLKDCVMVIVTKDKREFHQCLKENWPEIYRLYSDKFYGHDRMVSDDEHINDAFPRPEELGMLKEKAEKERAARLAAAAENSTNKDVPMTNLSPVPSTIYSPALPSANLQAASSPSRRSSTDSGGSSTVPLTDSSNPNRTASVAATTASLTNSATNSSATLPSNIQPLSAPTENPSKKSKRSQIFKFIPKPVESLARSMGSKIGRGLGRFRRDSSDD